MLNRIGIILFFVLGCFCTTLSYADTEAPTVLDDQLKQLNKEIETLSMQIDSYRHKGLDAEIESQKFMQSDWAMYEYKIKEAERYERLAREGEKRLQILMQKRDELVQHRSPPKKTP